MKISIFTILVIVTLIFWTKHVWSKPDLLNTSEQLVTLWFQQLWVFQFMCIILVIDDVFYFLIKDMKKKKKIFIEMRD